MKSEWKLARAKTLYGYAREYIQYQDALFYDAIHSSEILAETCESQISNKLANRLDKLQKALTYRDETDLKELSPEIDSIQGQNTREDLILNGIISIIQKTHRNPTAFTQRYLIMGMLETTDRSIPTDVPLLAAPFTVHGALAMLEYITQQV